MDLTGVETAADPALPVVQPYVQAAMRVNATELLGYDDGPDSERGLADLTNAGLRNIGNTCYINALLFCLSKLKKLQQMGLPALRKMQSRGLAIFALSSLHVGP